MKTQTVTLYIHHDLKPLYGQSEITIHTMDISEFDHTNCILIGTQEVEVTIPDVDINAQAIAKFDDNIARLRDAYHVAVAKEEAAKQEWLAIGVDR